MKDFEHLKSLWLRWMGPDIDADVTYRIRGRLDKMKTGPWGGAMGVLCDQWVLIKPKRKLSGGQ